MQDLILLAFKPLVRKSVTRGQYGNKLSSKDWGPKKVTIYFPIFYLVKSLENILFFYLHFI